MNQYNQLLDELNGKNINFLIGSGASVGMIPSLWLKPFNKSFEELLTSRAYNENQKKYYSLFGLTFG